MIHTQGLRRTFETDGETVEAVRGIDVDVAPGELIALLGPNGAGKSTMLRMLTTLLAPTGGTATVAGHDIRLEPVAVRRRIGYIGQGNGSYDGLRVHEELYAQGRFYGLTRHTARTRAADLLEQLQLSEQAGRNVARLSGGQRRRLDVAMGLIHRPPLVFLDEPSVGLDPQSRSNLWEHVSRMRQTDETTIAMTTHYLAEADAVADRVVVIDYGQIIADGTPGQLKSKVSGDLVSIEIADPADAVRAAEAVGQIPTAQEVTTTGDRVRFRTPRGDAITPEVVRALDTADIRLRGTQVQRPTLDDVFLTLTGRSLRENTA